MKTIMEIVTANVIASLLPKKDELHRQKGSRSAYQQYEISSLVCDQCDHTFDRIDDFTHHMKSYHTLPGSSNSWIHGTLSPHSLPFTCYGCDNRFPTQDRLAKHMNMKHGVSTAYPCSRCQNIFISSEFLESHKQPCHDFYNSPNASVPFS